MALRIMPHYSCLFSAVALTVKITVSSSILNKIKRFLLTYGYESLKKYEEL